MQVDTETLLTNSISDGPEVAPPSAMVVEKMVVRVVASDSDRQ